MAQPTADRMDEYRLKARCVRVFPDYVTWPADCGPKNRPLVIGVVGESPFGNHLNDLFSVANQQQNKPQLLYITKNLRAIETCDVLFICETESDRLYEILRMIKGRPILTIADSPDFARRGVMINLVMDRDRISLEVNLPILRLSELQVSP
ncbi:MAG: YfiR family protein, partial [Holophaga sp.]|nr:YfiR family protein [Holophaga sp.]